MQGSSKNPVPGRQLRHASATHSYTLHLCTSAPLAPLNVVRGSAYLKFQVPHGFVGTIPPPRKLLSFSLFFIPPSFRLRLLLIDDSDGNHLPLPASEIMAAL